MPGSSNNGEPAEKRPCHIVQSDETSFDIMEQLPTEIATKIFLFLDNYVVFHKCSLVNKRWNSFINSDLFWRSLLAVEFGEKAKIDDSVVRNVRDFIQFDAEIEFNDGNGIEISDEEPAELGRFLKIANTMEANYFEQNQLTRLDKYCVLKLPSFDFGLFLPIRIAVRLFPKFRLPVHLIDSKFNLLCTIGVPERPGGIWAVKAMPMSARFLVTKYWPLRLRFLLPSAESYIRKRQSIDTEFLIEAAAGGDVGRICCLLSEKHNADIDGHGRCRPLVEAAVNGHSKVVEILLEAGAKTDRNDGTCRFLTPLCAAAAGGHNDCIRLLLDHNVNVNSLECDKTALLTAIANAKIGTIKFLLEQGANFRICDSAGLTVFHYLATFFAKKYFDESYETANITAYEENIAKVLDWVIAAGCNVNEFYQHEKTAKMTPLMIACHFRNFSFAKSLLDRGADISVRTVDPSLTALSVAIDSGYFTENQHILLSLVEMLLERGGSCLLEYKNDRGLTPLASLFLQNEENGFIWDSSIFRLLIEKGADVNVKCGSNGGKTPLMYAAMAGDIDLVNLLIQHGANVNIRDGEGRTAILHVARTGSPHSTSIISALLNNGADSSLENSQGEHVADDFWSDNALLCTHCSNYDAEP